MFQKLLSEHLQTSKKNNTHAGDNPDITVSLITPPYTISTNRLTISITLSESKLYLKMEAIIIW